MTNKKYSIKSIREIIKQQYSVHYFARVHRWFAPYSLFFIAKTKTTPNQVTLLMLIFGLSSSSMLFFSDYYLYLLFIPIYTIYQHLDIIDGALARLKKIYSNKGIYLDYLSHLLVEPSMFFLLSLGRYLDTNNFLFIVFGVLLLASQMILRSINSLVIATRFKSKSIEYPKKRYNEQPIFRELKLPNKIKFFVTKIYFLPYLSLIFIFLLLINRPDYFIYFYGTTMPIIAIINIYLGYTRV